jgi:hypothetical protein
MNTADAAQAMNKHRAASAGTRAIRFSGYGWPVSGSSRKGSALGALP